MGLIDEHGQNVGRPRIKGTDPKVKAVTDRIGRGSRPMPRDVQAEQRGRGGLSNMAEASAQDDFAHRLQAGADAQAGQAQQLYDEGPKPRAKIRGRGQVQTAFDEDPNRYFYHYSPDDRFAAIKESGGLEPGKPGHFQESFSRGVHFSPGPNDYPAIGDSPMNVYRFPRDQFDPALSEGEFERGGQQPRDPGRRRALYQRSGDDFFSPERIPDPEVYTGTPGKPRWTGLSNTYNRTTTGLGLVSMLSSFLGGPYLQGPTDWVLNDVIAQNYAPGGALSPYEEDQYAPFGYGPNGGILA